MVARQISLVLVESNKSKLRTVHHSMRGHLFRCIFAACCFTAIFPVNAQQQFKPADFSAKAALSLVEAHFGQGSGMWIAEMEGIAGRPQPVRWKVIGYNPNSTSLLQQYAVQPGTPLDEGPHNNRYPNKVPDGFFLASSLIVDSNTAFTIAENEARKARMGFNRCDFKLKAREYSREPVYELSLIDVNQQLIGSVHISGARGTVLRTIWIQKNTISGYPKITDSLAPDSSVRQNSQTNQPLSPSQNSVREFVPPHQSMGTGVIPPPPVLSEIKARSSTEPNTPARNTASIFRNPPLISAQPVNEAASASAEPAKPVFIPDAPPIPVEKPTSAKRISAPTVPGGG